MRDHDMEALDRYQSSKKGKAYQALYDFENAVDDLTDAIKLPEGVECLQTERNKEGQNRFQEAVKKFMDVRCDLALSERTQSIAAE